ncbi:ABC-2 type transport system permease protein [Alkalithermobacter thermoalcaliphilus JW-YL-7 = DSM 7308]|uniref:ABC-2 type transport system permease protein n=1 Tax=Alkalithermobacter thermoalcaliphilus JW-YL-7 = DSM 7308 TaxID=1121328 RepID=A0A150FN18_CLOPD|nr:hypothetical protein JWYL7_0108 [[Clostridium] paradoxum JW-YL-7 = DSM 7308]SHL04640.1 ABC-2 type transport system permease protein [[Clostridium] paradoxum JW-YL-7 = DSM 7308]
MNKIISLTKIQLIDFFAKYTQQINARNKYLKIISLLIPLVVVMPVIQFVLKIYDNFSMIGYKQLTITYVYIGSVMIMFFSSIPFVISSFFYSKDLKFLTTLPIKASNIIFAKLSAIYIYLFGMGLLLFGSSCIVYIFKSGFDLYTLLACIIALLLLPIVPLLLSIIIVLPFMSFLAKTDKRNFLVLIGNIVLIVTIIYVQIYLAKVQMDPENFSSFLLKEDGLLYLIGRRFPPSIWLTKMVQGSFINALYFILLNIVFGFVFYFISSLLYKKALLIFNQESSSLVQRGKVYYKKKSKSYQMVKRHILIIFSNPIFLLNTVLTMMLPVIMFIVLFFTGEITTDIFNSPEIKPYIIYIYSLTITAPAIVGGLSATAITREGKAFWETMILPISAKDNIKYRVYSSIVLSLACSLVLSLLGGIYLPISLKVLTLSLVFCICSTLFFSTIDMIINIKRPLLNWSNPTAAVKNNLNVFLSLSVRIVIGFVYYFIYKIMVGFSESAIVLIFSVIFFMLYIATRYILYNHYTKDFMNIS